MQAMERTTSSFWLYVAPAIFTLLWAGGYGVAKLGLQSAEPMTLLALRYALAVLLLIPFFIFFCRHHLLERFVFFLRWSVVDCSGSCSFHGFYFVVIYSTVVD